MPSKDDLVVHLTHGIGIFNGLKHIDTFKRLIINHQDSIDKHYNKMEQSYRGAEEMRSIF